MELRGVDKAYLVTVSSVMKTVNCICAFCDKPFPKLTGEYNRRVKLGRLLYCTLGCAAKAADNLGDKRNTNPPPNGGWGKARQLDPFRYYIKCIKQRKHEYNVTLEYLAELWEQQKHICPYTGLTLQLMSHMLTNQDHRYSASLDRKDSKQGYMIGNVQFISRSINFMKNNMSHEHTVEFLKEISEYCLAQGKKMVEVSGTASRVQQIN